VKQRLLAISFVLIIILIKTVQPTLAASKYAGNYQTNTYCVQADITTPATQPNAQDGLEASWVDIGAPPYWVQTGWIQYQNFRYAQSYTEIQTNSYHHLLNWGVQNWGTSMNYKIVHVVGAVGWWVLYCNNSLKTMDSDTSLPSPPAVAEVDSEVQDSDTTVLNSNFYNVQYLDNNSQWHSFNQANWGNNLPYHVVSISGDDNYNTYGP